MYDYITRELPALVTEHLPVNHERCAIMGHSMGGHGALSIALKNPGQYRSVSAFSPIVAPTQCPWGEKAFSHYLGSNRDTWRAYDTCELIRDGADALPMLVDQGEADDFLANQLRTDLLENTCAEAGYTATIRRHAGYDHSYFFIASFIGSHIAFHMQHLR
jgi:S-formylglutathione hydrolase